MSPEQQAERAAHVALRNRLAEEARRFRLHWDPQSYRLYLRRELARNLPRCARNGSPESDAGMP